MNAGNMKKHFTEMYDAHADVVFRHVFLRVSDREQAIDIMQESFMKYWDALVKGTTIREPRAFLFTTVRRLIVDWYRKNKPSSLESALEDESMPEPVDLATSSEHIETSSEAKLLLDKLRTLGPTYEQPIYLRFIEGMTPQEIGDILGISESAVSVRIHRGIEKLRQINTPDEK